MMRSLIVHVSDFSPQDFLHHVCCAEVPAISRMTCYCFKRGLDPCDALFIIIVTETGTHMEENSILQDGEHRRLTKEVRADI